jgi:hypothetical protein
MANAISKQVYLGAKKPMDSDNKMACCKIARIQKLKRNGLLETRSPTLSKLHIKTSHVCLGDTKRLYLTTKTNSNLTESSKGTIFCIYPVKMPIQKNISCALD